MLCSCNWVFLVCQIKGCKFLGSFSLYLSQWCSFERSRMTVSYAGSLRCDEWKIWTHSLTHAQPTLSIPSLKYLLLPLLFRLTIMQNLLSDFSTDILAPLFYHQTNFFPIISYKKENEVHLWCFYWDSCKNNEPLRAVEIVKVLDAIWRDLKDDNKEISSGQDH